MDHAEVDWERRV